MRKPAVNSRLFIVPARRVETGDSMEPAAEPTIELVQTKFEFELKPQYESTQDAQFPDPDGR
jgi:hypothetical protein